MLYPGPDPTWPAQSGRRWTGGFVHHGGVDKAVCAHPSEHWLYWRGILPPHRLTGGAFGENFTLEGFHRKPMSASATPFQRVRPSQISQPRQPCWKLARRWQIKDLAVQMERTGFTGWYFRGIQEGTVEPGAPAACGTPLPRMDGRDRQSDHAP
ncbi:MAG: MOSC domain-containing protein [Nitrospira sp.]|nr:MOSC domain-containing protein [Nitrospira sp.]